MTEKTSISKKSSYADWFLQGALTKIGDTLDKLTGRKWIPSSTLATSELVERMKRLLDSEAKEIPGKGIVVPHNIKLKVQWDKFTTDAGDSLVKLEHELLTAAADHINDQLYYTLAPLIVEVKPDYFTEGVKLFASFDKFNDEEHEAELNVTIPSLGKNAAVASLAVESNRSAQKSEEIVVIARFALKGSRRDRRVIVPATGRFSVGRTGSNDLAIDDESVSKLHASLVADQNGGLSVADTGSTNGTFINGERIAYGKAVKLGKGDWVKFGMVDVVFEHVPAKPSAGENSARLSQEGTIEIDGFEFASRPISIDQRSPSEAKERPSEIALSSMPSLKEESE